MFPVTAIILQDRIKKKFIYQRYLFADYSPNVQIFMSVCVF
jgi:hypothetical protein